LLFWNNEAQSGPALPGRLKMGAAWPMHHLFIQTCNFMHIYRGWKIQGMKNGRKGKCKEWKECTLHYNRDGK